MTPASGNAQNMSQEESVAPALDQDEEKEIEQCEALNNSKSRHRTRQGAQACKAKVLEQRGNYLHIARGNMETQTQEATLYGHRPSKQEATPKPDPSIQCYAQRELTRGTVCV